MATKLPKEPETIPFSRLKYNVDKKRTQIATHQTELVELERELQLRCSHLATNRRVESRPTTDFYGKTAGMVIITCNECGLSREMQL